MLLAGIWFLMLCLGIESSCDETALALVRDGLAVDQVLASQADTHALFGGVVPELASREHYRYMGPLFQRLCARNGITPVEIDTIAVARGPGLLGCLLVGNAFAKGLALATGSRLVGVNHLHAHLLAPGLEQTLPFPALGLLISGGHTHLCRMDGPVSMTVLGKTLDDAAGEACDKFAKMLNLPYPGGALLDRLAQGIEPDVHLFPRPYTKKPSLDFSFSGLKTAASVYIAEHPGLVENGHLIRVQGEHLASDGLRFVCASYLHAVADTLRIKTELALSEWGGSKPKALIIAGGVAANSQIRAMMATLAGRYGLPLVLPSFRLCTDNAYMIAYAGSLLAVEGFAHTLSLASIPRGQAIPEDMFRV